MFFLPIGDQNPNKTVPYVNYLLIFINVAIFLMYGFSASYELIIRKYGFIPADPVPYTYFTSLFLHAGLGHLIGNMLYLWIAGDNVEDKLGHFWYLVFYLFAGAAADYIHAVMSPSMANIPTIGASGAISAVLGAYAIMFPKNRIVFFYFFFFLIGTFRVASFWAIGLWFVLQLLNQLGPGAAVSNVAYSAHIGGFIVGALIVGFLGMTGILKFHWRKEQDYRDIDEQLHPHPPGGAPWQRGDRRHDDDNYFPPKF